MRDDVTAYRVEPAGAGDAEAIVGFQLRMAMESEGKALDEATVRRGVAAVFADAGKGRYWVAREAAWIPGARKPKAGIELPGAVASLLIVPEWSDWRNGTVWWIHSVYVMPEHRRRGVYRAMYAHVRGIVERSADLCGLRLYVDKTNDTARGTYKALGMDGEHYQLFEWMKS